MDSADERLVAGHVARQLELDVGQRIGVDLLCALERGLGAVADPGAAIGDAIEERNAADAIDGGKHRVGALAHDGEGTVAAEQSTLPLLLPRARIEEACEVRRGVEPVVDVGLAAHRSSAARAPIGREERDFDRCDVHRAASPAADGERTARA